LGTFFHEAIEALLIKKIDLEAEMDPEVEVRKT
jgi:hypothetical protein